MQIKSDYFVASFISFVIHATIILYLTDFFYFEKNTRPVLSKPVNVELLFETEVPKKSLPIKNIQKKTIDQAQVNQVENKIELTPVIPETDINNLIKEDELAQEKSDNILINENNFLSALIIFFASTFYVIGGLLTLKISNKANENVTTSIMIWATIFLLPLSLFFEQPWNLTPRLDSTISLIYLGIFATGMAWLLRFYILKKNEEKKS